MMKVMFVDDRIVEIVNQWRLSGCESNCELLPLLPFDSVELTGEMVDTFRPSVIVIGYGLGKPDVTGSDVIQFLRKRGYKGFVVANSGGGAEQFSRDGVEVDGVVNRNPHDLKMVMENLSLKGM
jgi:hypothetical protein